MMKIITGPAQSDREEILTEYIRQAAAEKKRVIVIVPDQFSFEYDKMLYKSLGAGLFNSITTAGFNRLAELIATRYGGSAKDMAGDNAKMILMFKAVRRYGAEGRVKYYKNSLNKSGFISELITLTSQLRESGITPEDIRRAAESLSGTVALKLFDIGFIFGYYLEELEKAELKDSLSAMAEAVKLAESNRYFEGAEVFVTAFTGFSFDECKMLDLCVKDGAGVSVSLLMDEGSVKAYTTHPFGVTVKTSQQLVDLAKAHNKPVKFISAKGSLCKSEDIALLGKRLFNINRVEYCTEKDDVQIWAADDIYSEAEFICAEVVRLVRDKGYAFNDIAVTVRDLRTFAPIIEGALERYDIPYFIDIRDNVDASAIVHYINTLFKTVLTRKLRTENILKLIKSPLYGILNYEISDIEDYCTRWGVDGDMWLEPFTAKPAEGVSLERINVLREQIIAPLIKFKQAGEGKSAAEISRAFYELLSDVKLSAQTYSMVSRAASSNRTNAELERGLKQLWNMALTAVRSIYRIMGEDKISLRKYYELYSVMLSVMKTSNPPQKLECLRVTDAARSRIGQVRAVFAAEVNDGVFPAQVKGSGLVTEHEKELLKQQENIEIRAGVLSDFMHERLNAYSALCAPSERLYVCYSTADLLGSKKRPSMLVREVKEILGIGERFINALPLEFFCTSYKTAYVKYVEHFRERTAEMRSVYESLMDSQLYFDKISELKTAESAGEFSLSQKAAEDAFFGGKSVTTSPTRLDNYFKCPFMYFCSYGLKLGGEDRVAMNGLNKGLMVHSVLERAIDVTSKEAQKNREAFVGMSDDDIRALIEKTFTEYYNEVFCGGYGQSVTFDYRFEQMKQQCFYIVKYVQRELANSSFSPVITEYDLKEHGGASQLDLVLEDGRKIVLTGTIDRADIYENDKGERFVRIVDYKFRKYTDLSLAELYCGLDLQMLIYLSLLLETGNDINTDGSLKQAGVFYLKLFADKGKLRDDCDLTEEELYKAACESAVNAFERKGRITDNEGINKLLDKDISARSLSSITVSDSMLSAMRIFAKRKVVEYGNRLLKGDIAARPMENVCTYCKYSGICGKAFPDDPVKGSKEEMEQKLKEIVEEESGKVESKLDD